MTIDRKLIAFFSLAALFNMGRSSATLTVGTVNPLPDFIKEIQNLDAAGVDFFLDVREYSKADFDTLLEVAEKTSSEKSRWYRSWWRWTIGILGIGIIYGDGKALVRKQTLASGNMFSILLGVGCLYYATYSPYSQYLQAQEIARKIRRARDEIYPPLTDDQNQRTINKEGESSSM